MGGCCCGLYTTTDCFVNTTVKSASQMLPIPINVCLNNGTTWPVRWKSDGRWSKLNILMPIDVCTWPVDVPTCTLGAATLNFWSGDSLV